MDSRTTLDCGGSTLYKPKWIRLNGTGLFTSASPSVLQRCHSTPVSITRFVTSFWAVYGSLQGVRGAQSHYPGYGGMGQQTAGCTLGQTSADLSPSHLAAGADGSEEKGEKRAVDPPCLDWWRFTPNFMLQNVT